MHNRFVEMATRLINKNGRDAVLLVPNHSNVDGIDDTITWSVYGQIKVVQTSFSMDEKASGSVAKGDIKLLCDASIEPTTEMRLRDKGIDYTIVDVQVVQPGETSILYKIHCSI